MFFYHVFAYGDFPRYQHHSLIFWPECQKNDYLYHKHKQKEDPFLKNVDFLVALFIFNLGYIWGKGFGCAKSWEIITELIRAKRNIYQSAI